MKELIWSAFDAVEFEGVDAIKKFAEASFNKSKDMIEWLTMLVMVINHKSWDHYQKGNEGLQELYTDLYYEYYEKAINLLEKENRDEDLTYFIRTLD